MNIAALVISSVLLQGAGITESPGIKYHEGKDFDNRKHRLDLFMPKAKKAVPVILWIHGGAWKGGDKSLYSGLGRRFATEGIGFAAMSYRLSPRHKHPAHIEDCARAFSWVYRNVAGHGGNPDRLFVMGHSAGGHLTSLLAVHPEYLKAVDVPANAVKGAIPMSGVYRIPALPATTKGFLSIFPEAFGSDRERCLDASPVTHVANLSAPMLVITETVDNLHVRPSMHLLQAAVKRKGAKNVEFMDAKDRDHGTIIMRMVGSGPDPIRDRIVRFVRDRCRELDGSR